MTEKEIIQAIEGLSKCQGFYGRVLEFIENDERGPAFLSHLAEQNFADVVDMVMFLES